MKKVMISLVAVLAITASASAANLIVDGDFEAANSAAWTHVQSGWGSGFSFTTESTPGYAGLECAKLTQSSGSHAYIQTFTVPMNVANPVTISWAFKGITGGDNGWMEVLLGPAGFNWDGPSDDQILAKRDYPWPNAYPTPSGNWETGSTTKTLTAGASYTIAIKAGGNPGSVQAFFDDIVVTPEPAAALLLGLPLLFVRRRRA